MMQEMTQYLYEFQNGERVRNIGFIKLDNQMDRSGIRIYAKDMDDIKGIIFQRPNGEIYMGTWEEGGIALPTTPQPRETLEREGMVMEQEMETDEDTYVLPNDVRYEKIQRQDLSRLPRKEWRLANNSFLLHGYYNYHHLLYIEEGGQIWIGVPGIFHEKEQLAANNFGFSRFLRLTDADIELHDNETNTYEDFGYWCRQISEPKV